MNLQTLKTEILADGVVDAGEVNKLREVVLADGVVDRQEAEVLFEINDQVTGKANAPEWGTFFVDAITDHVLKQPTIDDTWLINKVMGDGQVDDLEKRLLTNIKAKATTVPTALQTKFTELGI